MESDVSEASIAYDEQFEDEDVNGDITAVAPTASPFPAPPLSGRSAAAALLTDTELDEYLDDEEPRTAANNYSSKGTEAAVQAQPALLQPAAAAAAGSPATTATEAASRDQSLQENNSRRHSLSSRNSNRAPSQPLSRQLSSSGSKQNLQPHSRRTSRNSSGHSRNSSSHAPAAAQTVIPPAAVAQDQPVYASADNKVDFQQQDSLDEAVAELDSSYAPAAVSTPKQAPAATAAAAAAATSAGNAPWLSSTPAAGWQQAAAPAPAADSGWWDNEQQQQQQQQQQQHAQLVRAASQGMQPSSTAASAAAAFSLNSAAAVASAAAGAAAHEAVHAVPHKPGRRQRPASASAGRRSSRHDQQQQEQLTTRSSWHNEMHEQQQPPAVLPIEQWAGSDVCDWVEGIGLPQYRKKFMHHCIGGRLLLRLTDELLKKELGIGPLGHRALLLEAIEAVSTADLAAAAAAAAAGTPAAEFAPVGTSPSAAAALLVAGCVAASAAGSQRSPSRRGRSAGSAAASRSSNAYSQHQAGSRIASAGSGSYSSTQLGVAAGGCEPAAADRGAGSAGGSPVAAGRARPSSAPARGRQGRSSSPHATSPGALGPAAGRISVYEQRAKLLFELGRAQARAAAQSSSAAQVGDVARLAAEEVARLQGQLADLNRKNRLQVEYGAGSVDSRGHIPWQHVGAGTHAGHPHPESHARPWDPPDTDLTFSPKISAKSQQLMAEQRGQGGNGGFLARLDNDLKRRQVKIKELERRYNAFGPGAVSAADAAAAAKAAAADVSLVLGFLSQRGWADLSVPTGSSSGGGGGGMDAAAQQELDEQLDEVVESHSRELSLGEAQLRGILAARGHKKVAALAAVVRTQQFMDRYKADLSTRDSRLSELQEKWFKQQLQGAPASTGPTGRAPAAPLTAEQRDMQQALQWFRQLGWDVAEPEDDCEDQLSALIKRARAYKAEVEKLHDKAAAAAATGAQQAAAAAVGEPQINWQGIPWRDDGLNDLIQKVLDAQRAAADSAASKAAAASKPSAVDAALKAAGKAGRIAGSMNTAAAEGRGEKKNPLDHAVQLLAGMRWAGLDQLDAAAGAAKKLAVYRALRTQQFLEFTANDLAAREAKQRALWAEFEASRRGKVVSKAELDEFYARLQADGERRKAELAKAKADKEERAARALALVSVGAGRSTRSSARSRPASAK